MNLPGPETFFAAIVRDLREHLDLCHECLALFTVENRLLRGATPWEPAEFSGQRKRLLPRLESVLIKLRGGREAWQKVPEAERERCGEVNNMFRELQNLLPRVLLLDRENQQEMLRRGAVPAAQLPPAASQQPDFVASLYRRHTAV